MLFRSKQHHQAINADPKPTGGRQPILKGPQVVLVDRHSLLVAGLPYYLLVGESGPLVVRPHYLGERVTEFPSRPPPLAALHKARLPALVPRRGSSAARPGGSARARGPGA